MQYLRYSEFEKEIRSMATAATHDARLGFARDTIRLLHQSVATAISQELTETEQRLLDRVLAGIQADSFPESRAAFEELDQSTCEDDVRAIELHPDLTELLCVIDNLLAYVVARDPQLIARIAINMVNCIDYAIDGLPENIMAAPQMQDEFKRQQRLLGGA
jgi:hypothetical protein